MQNKTRQKKYVVFAVMGATGAGKSAFIRLLINDKRIHINHNQESKTSDIQTATYIDKGTGRSVMLIDTPGFDDSREDVTDTTILRKVVEYLEPENRERQKLNGVIYMHSILDPRVGGVSRRNLRMLYSFCGEGALLNVCIVTTNWDCIREEEGNYREADLKNGAFKVLVDAGARMRRHENTLESARDIMEGLISLPEVTMKIQEELRNGRRLADTAAGKVLTAEMREMQKKHELKMADLKRKMETVAKANDHALRAEFAQERKALEDKIASGEADREKLERTLEERNKRDKETAQLKGDIKKINQEKSELKQQLANVNNRIAVLESGCRCVIC